MGFYKILGLEKKLNLGLGLNWSLGLFCAENIFCVKLEVELRCFPPDVPISGPVSSYNLPNPYSPKHPHKRSVDDMQFIFWFHEDTEEGTDCHEWSD